MNTQLCNIFETLLRKSFEILYKHSIHQKITALAVLIPAISWGDPQNHKFTP